MNIERKTVGFEVKEVDEEAGVFTGYASTFSDVPDSYGDIVDRGAFTKTLVAQKGQIVSLFNHSIMDPIGKPTEMAEDEKGLLIKGQLSLGVQRARETLSLMKDGVITQMSIGYETITQSYEKGVRHLKEIKLYDVSPVIFAANPEAVIVGVKEKDPAAEEDETYKCECIECGHELTSKKHCSDIKCPKCGSEMRRVERPGPGKSDKDNLAFADQAEAVLAAVTEWIDRTKSLADLRLKEGRVLSTANRKRLASLLEALGKMASDITELLEATQPGDDEKMVLLTSLVSGLKAENDGFDVKEAERRIEAILDQIKQEVK